ncbi:glutamate--tRNA ligase [Aureimonas jatrophae]|uniref:Glutamate--tRNA ligase n=1 Tax=Aureimonas jatrophae TaxID=1166073 RepID=A0A1H0GHK2_9HYPH|nr:glutamate--tRNA ligase [Aureimonas jatrophae]MBB3949574.1 glutamyl-tRNA synthetase [Aureimonas jatrophae]SDO06364.1 glutamyl-tRNA synthetase [Aureimonas jatrophae]
MAPIVRFAPSPTGYLHIGNLRPALFNWLFAQREGGRFILRYDDTDLERSKREYADAVLEDIAWIGIHPDEIVRQSDRLDRYDAAFERLRASGAIYPCFETPDELERARRRRLARGLSPVYTRDALRLGDEERSRLAGEGRQPYWRFRLPNAPAGSLDPVRTEIRWTDLVRGEEVVDLSSLSDPVVRREDGTYLYTFTSVVDDADMGVTHILRGDDHVTNTGVQIAMFEALGVQVPRFGHFNLLTTIDGEGLSKRSGALSLRTLRSEGYEPMAIASLAVLTGLSGSIEAVPDLESLARRLDFDAVSLSSAKFDPANLLRLNAELVHAKPTSDVASALADMGVPSEQTDAFWLAVRGNCERVSDARDWADIVWRQPAGDALLQEGDRAFVREALDLLPSDPFEEATWKRWTDTVKARTERKGRALFLPLRVALTGREHGPDMSALLPLIGRQRALERRP